MRSLFSAHLWPHVTAHPQETLCAGRAAPRLSALTKSACCPTLHPKWRKEEHDTGFPLPFVRASLWHEILSAATSWPSAASPRSSRGGRVYLSYTTSLQLRTTVIPDTVAIVAWTIDTNLKRKERERVTPDVAAEGPRSRAGGLGCAGRAVRASTPAPRAPRKPRHGVGRGQRGCARCCHLGMWPGACFPVSPLPPAPRIGGDPARCPRAEAELHRSIPAPRAGLPAAPAPLAGAGLGTAGDRGIPGCSSQPPGLAARRDRAGSRCRSRPAAMGAGGGWARSGSPPADPAPTCR